MECLTNDADPKLNASNLTMNDANEMKTQQKKPKKKSKWLMNR